MGFPVPPYEVPADESKSTVEMSPQLLFRTYTLLALEASGAKKNQGLSFPHLQIYIPGVNTSSRSDHF